MIYHWCDRSDWARAGVAYTAPSLVDEGFIHFSYKHQVARTAFATDPGHQNLVLLCVDESDLEVVDEDCYELGEEYPHVYAPIPVVSVVAVLPFPSEPDGTFRLPEGLPE
jgi:uncharacterized protein (DUF952 family)